MSLQTRLASLITAIGADIKAIKTAAEFLESGRAWVLPGDGGSTLTYLGAPTLSLSGTATSAARATTNRHQRSRRLDLLVTSASSSAVAGWRSTNGIFLRGNAAGVGGFFFRQTWGPATGVSTSTTRAFVGLTASISAPSDAEPSTSFVTCIGMGWDAADTNVQMMYNDGSGSCTKVDLGSSFPVPTSDRTALYQCDIWCAANESKLYWKVVDLVNNVTTSGDTDTSTNIPANTTYLMPRGQFSVGGTSSVIGVALCGIHYQAEP